MCQQTSQDVKLNTRTSSLNLRVGQCQQKTVNEVTCHQVSVCEGKVEWDKRLRSSGPAETGWRRQRPSLTPGSELDLLWVVHAVQSVDVEGFALKNKEWRTERTLEKRNRSSLHHCDVQPPLFAVYAKLSLRPGPSLWSEPPVCRLDSFCWFEQGPLGLWLPRASPLHFLLLLCGSSRARLGQSDRRRILMRLMKNVFMIRADWRLHLCFLVVKVVWMDHLHLHLLHLRRLKLFPCLKTQNRRVSVIKHLEQRITSQMWLTDRLRPSAGDVQFKRWEHTMRGFLLNVQSQKNANPKTALRIIDRFYQHHQVGCKGLTSSFAVLAVLAVLALLIDLTMPPVSPWVSQQVTEKGSSVQRSVHKQTS